MKRVVITGMGCLSPFGEGVPTLMDALREGKSGITQLDELSTISGLRPTIAGKIPAYNFKSIPRKYRRTMSAMSIFATIAAQEAITQAGLDEKTLTDSRTGLSVSSTVGSVQTLQSFFSHFLDGMSIEGIKTTEFFKIMNHSCASNLAQRFGITGRVVAPSAACSTGCQTIGFGAEAIAMGKQDIMICGGADELHPLTVGTFDIIQAASTEFNNHPTDSPRPFDTDRDGIVCSEGAGVIVLESLESALSRDAKILGELTGFSSTSDPSNPATPSAEALAECMRLALEEAKVAPEDVDYVNAHATGTKQGDAAESAAIASLMNTAPAVSSLKGHLGHTMAASGALEIIATISMINIGLVIPTRNLICIAPDCEGPRLIRKPAAMDIKTALKNNFALGGVNTSIVLRRYDD